MSSGFPAGGFSMNSETRVKAVFYITEEARPLAEDIAYLYSGAKTILFSAEFLPALWSRNNGLIFIMPLDIVVHALAPFIREQTTDPVVVVVDEKSEFVISLLSGYPGAANALAEEIAPLIGAKLALSVSSNSNEAPLIDVWAAEKGLLIEDWGQFPDVADRLRSNGILRLYSECEIELPDAFLKESEPDNADVLVTKYSRLELSSDDGRTRLYLRPRKIAVGIECGGGVEESEIEEAVSNVFRENNLSTLSICRIATISSMAGDRALARFADKCGAELYSFSADKLNMITGVERFKDVFLATGAYAIAVPSAMLAARSDRLLIPLTKSGKVKLAAVETRDPVSGKLYIIGVGPGGAWHITQRAAAAIKESHVIAGYETCLNLIPDLITRKEIIPAMRTEERECCIKAMKLANSGKIVAMVICEAQGFDVMDSLIYEMLNSLDSANRGHDNSAPDKRFSVEVIPGISALNATAARLGIPLMQNYVSINLDDGFTPWETTEIRLEAAARADFMIALCLIGRGGQSGQFSRALEIISRHRKPDTPVGVLRGNMKPASAVVLTDLEKVGSLPIDRLTTVIVGNADTVVRNGRMAPSVAH
jgi:cobalt-precorrin 5A hydrolase / precorrin-3B C17-methyltransferase